MDTKKFRNFLTEHELIHPNDRIIVGVSGGPDSVALLSLFCNIEYPLTPIAVYVDHGLRPEETGAEIELIKEISHRFGVDHEILRVDVAEHRRLNKISMEMSGRILRYEALEKMRLKYQAQVIAVGHTADDQAEEILLRLFRGTGLKGLSGMQLKNGHIIRPLLTTTKDEILQYLNENSISFCIDSSNLDKNIQRNRVRLEVLPAIRQHFNPSVDANLCHTANILAQENDYLDRSAENEMKNCALINQSKSGSLESISLSISSFNTLHIALQRRIAEKVILKFGVQPTFQQITDITRFSLDGKNGSSIHLPFGLRVHKANERILFFQPEGHTRLRGEVLDNTFSPLSVELDKEYLIKSLGMKLHLHTYEGITHSMPEDVLLLDGDKLTFPLELRRALPGERFRPAGMKGSKKVSRFLSDCKIPRHERSQYPVLVADGCVAAVLPLRVSSLFAVDDNTRVAIMVKWQRADSENGNV